MPRIPRNHMTVSFFHIMTQGINKEYIFGTNEEKIKYLKLINSEEKSLDIKILSYCIMDNHSHILINTQNINDMATFMHKINTQYAVYYNKKHDRTGYVFKNRYKSQVIMSLKHLYRCIDYIHENPIKAGICEDKSDYRFSSFSMLYNNSQENVRKNLEISILQSEKRELINNDENDLEFHLLECDKVDKNQICKKEVDNYLKTKNISMVDLHDNRKYLKELVKLLKLKNISFRTMENIIQINRESLRKLLKND